MTRRTVFRSFFVLCLLGLLLVIQPVHALRVQLQENGAARLPDTPVAAVARSFFDALTTGDASRLLEFIKANYSSRALEETPEQNLLAYFRKLYQQSGGLEIMQVSPDSNERFLVVDVKSKRGSHWARMFFLLQSKDTKKLTEVGMFAIRDPEAEKLDVWPKTRMSPREVVREIARHVGKEAREDRFSGVVLVSKADRVIFHRAYGMAEKGFKVPNRPDTKFNLASMNKMFTSLAIAQLVEKGKLSFEDTLAKVFPEYPNNETAKKITIHQLLTHSAGLGDFFGNPEFRPHRERYKNPRDYLPLFANEPLRFGPGSRFGYSNAGYVVLGAVVEKLSGENYFDYVREHIFKPAGMLDTDSYELTEVVPNLAVGYGRFEDDPMGVDPRRSNIAFLPWRGSPAGGGYSTAPDLLRFAQALRAHKLVNAQLTELITSPKIPMAGSPRPAKYGYGFVIETVASKETRGHGGGGANSGINSDMRIFWDGSYVAIVMSNYDSPAADGLNHKISEFLAHQ
jgi:D-alanyl-D-alanine carboxypeptidase